MVPSGKYTHLQSGVGGVSKACSVVGPGMNWDSPPLSEDGIKVAIY